MKPLNQWDTRKTVPGWSSTLRIMILMGTFSAAVAIGWSIGTVWYEPPSIARTIAIIVTNMLMVMLGSIFMLSLLKEIEHQLRQRWLPFDSKENGGSIVGVETEGDPKATPVTWLNQFFVKFFWNKVAVLKIDQEAIVDRLGHHGLEWRIGFKPKHGNAKLKVQVLTTDTVRVRIGYESCHFFAIGLDEKEIPLDLVDTAAINDPRYADVPLH